MIQKALLIAVPSGLIVALLVPILYYVYLEISLKDPVSSQYNGLILVFAAIYVLPAVLYSFVCSLIVFKKTDLNTTKAFILVTFVGVIGMAAYYIISNLITYN